MQCVYVLGRHLLLQIVGSADESTFSSCSIFEDCAEINVAAGASEMLVKSVVMEAAYHLLQKRSLVPVVDYEQSSSSEPDEDDCLYGSDADSVIEW